jgi:hypothetical protein
MPVTVPARIPLPAECKVGAAVAPAIAPRPSKANRWIFVASVAMLVLGAAVSGFLSRNREMVENVLKYTAENVAAAAKSSHVQPDARHWKGGEAIVPSGEAQEAEVVAKRKQRDESLIGRADESTGNGELGAGTGVPRIRTVSDNEPASPMLRTVVADDSGNAGPQFSPDGKRIAYMSTRTGPWQIWISNTDGSNPRQVSFTESAGTPRWSPDGRSIAFDAPYDGQTRIFVVQVDGNEQARPIVKGLVPSFSRDGKWIYFASDQTGDWQVWKAPVGAGAEVQITTNGGFAALESADGYVYYSKSRYPQPEICRVPVNGGAESCVLQHLRPRTWASWAVTRAGIVFAEDLPSGRPTLSLYDPAKRQVRDLVSLRSAPFWVGASADGKRAIMNDAEERQISMVDNLP